MICVLLELIGAQKPIELSLAQLIGKKHALKKYDEFAKKIFNPGNTQSATKGTVF